jgi:hypothetical protein
MRTRSAALRQVGLPHPYSKPKPLVIEEVELAPPGRGEGAPEATPLVEQFSELRDTGQASVAKSTDFAKEAAAFAAQHARLQ